MKSNKNNNSQNATHFLKWDSKELFISNSKKSILKNWVNYLITENLENQSKNVFCFYGYDKFSQERLTAHIGSNIKKKIAVIDIDNNIEKFYKNQDKLNTILDNCNAVIVIQLGSINNFEDKDKLDNVKSIINYVLEKSNLLFIHSNKKLPFLYTMKDCSIFELFINLESQEIRQKIWQHYIDNNLTDINFDKLHSFKFYEGQIYSAVNLAKNQCLSLGDKSDEKFTEELLRACHDVSQHHLSELAVELKSSYTLEDLVLDEYSESLIQQCLSFIKYKDLAYSTCGLDKSPYGKGINILFTGKSGTGKTMGATVLANELGYPVYKINLSAIVSKWLGETQKNISKIFDEAKRPLF